MLEKAPRLRARVTARRAAQVVGGGRCSEADGSPQPCPAHRVARDRGPGPRGANSGPSRRPACLLSHCLGASNWGNPHPKHSGKQASQCPVICGGDRPQEPWGPHKKQKTGSMNGSHQKDASPWPVLPRPPAALLRACPPARMSGTPRPAGPILGRFSTLGSKLVKMTVRHTAHS